MERGELLAEGHQQDTSARVSSQKQLGPKGLEATQPRRQLLKEFGQGRTS